MSEENLSSSKEKGSNQRPGGLGESSKNSKPSNKGRNYNAKATSDSKREKERKDNWRRYAKKYINSERYLSKVEPANKWQGHVNSIINDETFLRKAEKGRPEDVPDEKNTLDEEERRAAALPYLFKQWDTLTRVPIEEGEKLKDVDNQVNVEKEIIDEADDEQKIESPSEQITEENIEPTGSSLETDEKKTDGDDEDGTVSENCDVTIEITLIQNDCEEPHNEEGNMEPQNEEENEEPLNEVENEEPLNEEENEEPLNEDENEEPLNKEENEEPLNEEENEEPLNKKDNEEPVNEEENEEPENEEEKEEPHNEEENKEPHNEEENKEPHNEEKNEEENEEPGNEEKNEKPHTDEENKKTYNEEENEEPNKEMPEAKEKSENEEDINDNDDEDSDVEESLKDDTFPEAVDVIQEESPSPQSLTMESIKASEDDVTQTPTPDKET